MKTESKVILSHPELSLVAVETEIGKVTVFEMLGCESIQPGDIVVGYLDQWGNQTLFNETRDEEFPAYVHEFGCTLESAVERYFNQPTFSASEES